MRSHFISIIMTAITKQTEISKYWRGCGELASTGEDVEKLESVSNVTENENGAAAVENSTAVPQRNKIKIE